MATIDRTKEENKQTLNLILTKPGVDYWEEFENLTNLATHSLNQELIGSKNLKQLKAIETIDTNVTELKKDIRNILEVHKQGYNSLENLITLVNE
jgi:hypothetical protein